jgi:hypothetical protein
VNKNSLNLRGDGDELDVIYDVERIFDVKLTNREAEALRTVGDLYDLILSKRRSVDHDTRACLSQASFYRLRRAFAEMGLARAIEPTTPLEQAISSISGTKSIQETWKELGRTARLHLPPLEVRWLPGNDVSLWGKIAGWLGIFVSGAVVTFALHHVTGMNAGWAILSNILVLPLFGVAGALFLQRCFGTISRRIETVGDLAREAAGFTFRNLWQEKKGYGPSDLWFALVAILRPISSHKDPIYRETTFFARQTRTT